MYIILQERITQIIPFILCKLFLPIDRCCLLKRLYRIYDHYHVGAAAVFVVFVVTVVVVIVIFVGVGSVCLVSLIRV